MTQPLGPFNTLFAQLSQGMSVVGGRPVVNELGWQNDTQHTTAERVVWIPESVGVGFQPFQLAGQKDPYRQVSGFNVSLYGDSYDRVLELHGLLVGWLDVLVGPAQGCAPSDDATPAVLRGVVDLADLNYPLSDLIGTRINVAAPLARALAFPGTALDAPQAIATAVNLAAIAAGLLVRARLHHADTGEAYLELLLPTDPLGTVGATLTINPDVAGSACETLGFSADDDNLTATGTAPTWPYRPGYEVDKTAVPGPRGGNAASSGWGMVVPVTLYRPIASMHYLTGVIADTPTEVVATGGSEPDEIVIDIP